MGRDNRRRKLKSFMNTKKEPRRKKTPNAFGMKVNELWHKVDGTLIEDLEQYIFEYIADAKDEGYMFGATDGSKYEKLEIFIGTDGIAKGAKDREGVKNSELRLMTVICFRKVGRGVHIIKRKESQYLYRKIPTGEKLNAEVNKTYELAMYFREIGVEPHIHLDLNPNQDHESFNVYNVVKGWFESMDFVTEYKPDGVAAMVAADYYI